MMLAAVACIPLMVVAPFRLDLCSMSASIPQWPGGFERRSTVHSTADARSIERYDSCTNEGHGVDVVCRARPRPGPFIGEDL